eukprot:318624-Amphidinium_carterae.1
MSKHRVHLFSSACISNLTGAACHGPAQQCFCQAELWPAHGQLSCFVRLCNRKSFVKRLLTLAGHEEPTEESEKDAVKNCYQASKG